MKHTIAANVEQHPGVVEFSRIVRLWGKEATQDDLRKCLDGLKVPKMELNGDTYFIFREILVEVYTSTGNMVETAEQRIRELKKSSADVQAKIETIREIADIWLEGWPNQKTGKKTNEAVTGRAIRTFVSSRFEAEEKETLSQLDNQKKEIKREEASLAKSRLKLENLLPFYAALEKKG